MADSGSPMLFKEEELTCSICLDLFSDPVSTPCGHNFCQSCIGGYWATGPASSCPLCKRVFTERPELSVNRIFARITDSYKASRFGAAASARVITCDVCPAGRKLQAVWSCLTCCMSYCQEHAQPHLQTPYYSHHQLLEPHDAFRGRTCPTHHRLLEVYCCTDQESICAICVLEKHCTHRTVSVQMERVNKEKILRKTELEIQNRTEEKTARLTELKGKVESLRNFALSEAAEVDQILTEVSASVAQIRRELLGGIEEKQAVMEARGRELISQLEVDLKQLKDCSASLGQTAATEDHIGFLQSFQKAVALPLTEGAGPGAGPEPDLGLELRLPLSEVKQELQELLERLQGIHMGEGPTRRSSVLSESESMMSLPGLRKKEWSLRNLTRIRPGSGLKKVRAFSDDITLNPLTAYPFLILSDDRKQLKRGEKQQSYRNSTQRYDVWSCVLAKEGFTSGRHYWEVNVGENKDWKVGLVRESAKRKGLFDMTPNNGYYVLWWGCNQLRALTEPPLTKVKLSSRLRRVGVYVDHEEGQVTFYNAKSGSEVFAFSGLEFAERTLPLFGTGDKEVPLVLMTVHCNIPE